MAKQILTRSLLGIGLSVALFLSPVQGRGQTQPVVINPGGDAPRANDFIKALKDVIRLSDRFSIWDGRPFDLPKNGVRLDVLAIFVPSGDVHDGKSAVFTIASVPSKTERGYFKQVLMRMDVFTNNEAVADAALEFMATLRKELPKQSGENEQ